VTLAPLAIAVPPPCADLVDDPGRGIALAAAVGRAAEIVDDQSGAAPGQARAHSAAEAAAGAGDDGDAAFEADGHGNSPPTDEIGAG
jgi:hypothetical protein